MQGSVFGFLCFLPCWFVIQAQSPGPTQEIIVGPNWRSKPQGSFKDKAN